MIRRYYLVREVKKILGLTHAQYDNRVRKLGIKSKNRRITLKDFDKIKNYKPGTPPKGENHYRSKLNKKKVLDIIDTKGEYDALVVADYYKVSVSTVQSIRAGKTWKHLQPINKTDETIQ